MEHEQRRRLLEMTTAVGTEMSTAYLDNGMDC